MVSETIKFPMTITLSRADGWKLQRTIPLTIASRTGGFQRLLMRLQADLVEPQRPPAPDEYSLTVRNFTDAERILRYADGYGSGGYQDRLAPIADKLREAGFDPVDDSPELFEQV